MLSITVFTIINPWPCLTHKSVLNAGSCISDGPESKTGTLVCLSGIDVSNFQSVDDHRRWRIRPTGIRSADSTVTLQKVLDNKSSQLILCLWLCSVPYGDGWNYSTGSNSRTTAEQLSEKFNLIMHKPHTKLTRNQLDIPRAGVM